MVITKLRCILIIFTGLHFKPDLALFKYVVMLLGLSNAPRTFQRLINSVFHKALDCFCTVYLNYILIYSSSTSEHL